MINLCLQTLFLLDHQMPSIQVIMNCCENAHCMKISFIKTIMREKKSFRPEGLLNRFFYTPQIRKKSFTIHIYNSFYCFLGTGESLELGE